MLKHLTLCLSMPWGEPKLFLFRDVHGLPHKMMRCDLVRKMIFMYRLRKHIFGEGKRATI